MANPFDEFDDVPQPMAAGANPFDEFDAPAGAEAPPWYAHLMAGLGHKLNVGREREAMGVENPLATSVRNAMPLGVGAMLPNSWFEGLNPQTLSGLVKQDKRTRGGVLEQAAHAETAKQDAADAARGIGKSLPASILYGLGESPEAIALPIMRGAPILSGAMQGFEGAASNDRDPVAGTLGGGIGGGLGRLFNMAGNKTFNALRGAWADPEAKATDALAKTMKANLSAGDLSPGGFWSWLENKAKWTPGSGVPAARKEQAQAIGNVAEGISGDLRAPIAARLDAGVSPEELIAGSARARERQARDRVRALFAQVPADVKVETPQFNEAIKKLMGQYKGALSEGNNVAPTEVHDLVNSIVNPKRMELTPGDEALIAGLGGRERLTPRNWQQLQEHSPGIMGRAGGAEIPPEPMTAMQTHWLQSHLGNIARTQEMQGANPHMVGLVHEARSALLGDVDNVDNQTIPEAFRVARDAFKREVAPFDNNPILRKLVSSPNAVDETLFSKVGADRVNTARALMENLTPEGIAALRYGLASRGINRGVNEKLESGLSIPALIRNLDLGVEQGNQRALTELMPPEMQNRISDLTDVAKRARNAGTWSHEPPTGVQNVGLNMIKTGLGAAGLGTGTGSEHMQLGGLAMAALPVVAARLGPMFSRTGIGKNAILAKNTGALDPYIEALLAEAMAGRAKPASLFDQVGQ